MKTSAKKPRKRAKSRVFSRYPLPSSPKWADVFVVLGNGKYTIIACREKNPDQKILIFHGEKWFSKFEIEKFWDFFSRDFGKIEILKFSFKKSIYQNFQKKKLKNRNFRFSKKVDFQLSFVRSFNWKKKHLKNIFQEKYFWKIFSNRPNFLAS